MSRPKVFICSQLSPTPTSTMEQNMARTRKFCRFAFDKFDVNPFAPHLFYTQFLDDKNTAERQAGLFMGIDILKGCKRVLVFVLDDFISVGMKLEIQEAEFQGIIVEFFRVDFEGNILGKIKKPQA